MAGELYVYSLAFTASVMVEAHSEEEAKKRLRIKLFHNPIGGHTICITGDVRIKNNGVVI